MKSLIVLAALAVCAFAAPKIAPLLAEDSKTRIPGEYVVVFEETIGDKDVLEHMKTVRDLMSYHGNQTNTVVGEYHIGTFRGYGAKMDDKLRDSVRMLKHVQYVECSQVYHTMQDPCSLEQRATWGIVRTTYHDRPGPSDNGYSYKEGESGEEVNVYIIDTGIFLGHPDFGGRARWGADFIDNPSPETDLNGHGTHVAGTVMSDTWGIAKRATSIAVRVLDQNGSGSNTGVIAGVNWVTNQHSRGKKSVANMSLGGGKSTALNSAVNSAVDAGVHFAVAAGNEGQDACNVSPASAEKAITVGASDEDDQFAYFSNYGRCEDIIGPGVDITSTWNNGGTNTISGTSMASPHVAGVIAEYLTTNDYTPAEMKDELVKEASRNYVSGLTGSKATTPNLLVFKDCV